MALYIVLFCFGFQLTWNRGRSYALCNFSLTGNSYPFEYGMVFFYLISLAFPVGESSSMGV